MTCGNSAAWLTLTEASSSPSLLKSGLQRPSLLAKCSRGRQCCVFLPENFQAYDRLKGKNKALIPSAVLGGF